MIGKVVTALMLGAALLSAGADAAACKKDADCSSGQVCSAGTCASKRSSAAKAADTVAPTEATTGTKRSPYIAWGGLGVYDVTGPGGGSAKFGLHVGGSANLIQVARDLPVIAWGDIGLGLGSDLFFPFAVGAGVRYDKLGPVQVLGGVGFAWLPNTSSGPNPVGVRLMAMGLYPLPQLHPRVSGQAQISYDFLSDSAGLFAFTVGLGYAL